MMVLAPFLALHLLASTQGQLSDKERAQYQQAVKMAHDPKVAEHARQQALINGQPPKTCDDRCALIKRSMDKTCKNLRAKRASAGQRCSQSMKQIVEACRGSCQSKGKIDKDYMKSHIKMPKQPSGNNVAGHDG